MNDPLVSVLIPAYNGERFLRAAVRSALDQTYKNIEVIVGDDASSDRTPTILAAVADADPRVRVIRHEVNVGGFENPRSLFAQARGEFVKFLLHDDTLATDCVRVLVRGLQATPDALMAFSRRNVVGEDGRPVPGGELAPLQAQAGRMEGLHLGDRCLESNANLIGELTTVLFRADAVSAEFMWQVDDRQLEVLGDLSLWLRLLSRGSAFYSPQALSRFRQHGEQASHEPRAVVRGMRDWPRLLDWATRQGFLAHPDQQRRAFARVLSSAARRVETLADKSTHLPALEAVMLATARLAELAAADGALSTQPLELRAHGEESLTRLAQELDARCGTFAVAVATATAEPETVDAALSGLREVIESGVAERCVLAVEPDAFGPVEDLIGSARFGSSVIDVELVPTTSPQALFRNGWLAVARRSDRWHHGRADAIWLLDPTRIASREGSSVLSR